MGKGDKKSKKGKRILGTYGNSRKKKVATPIAVTKKKSKPAKAEKTEEVKEAPVKKAAAKKTATKKTAVKKTTAKKPAASEATEAKEK